MVRRISAFDIVDLLGIVIMVGGVTFNNIYVIGFGVILIIVYIGDYANEKFIKRIKKMEKSIQLINEERKRIEELTNMKERISKNEGALAVLRSKKGIFNPITLLVILIILILLVFYLKGKGII